MDDCFSNRIVEVPGHIVPNDANDPGLVYDVSDDQYDAFACGILSPAVSAERCDELGVTARLMKPVKLSELFDAVILQQRREFTGVEVIAIVHDTGILGCGNLFWCEAAITKNALHADRVDEW